MPRRPGEVKCEDITAAEITSFVWVDLRLRPEIAGSVMERRAPLHDLGLAIVPRLGNDLPHLWKGNHARLVAT